MLSMMDRIKIEEKAIPEASAMPISKFARLHPALHQACCTFTSCEDRTERLMREAEEMIAHVLKPEDSAQYLETLILLYATSGEAGQAAALLRLQHDMNLTPKPQTFML